MMKRVCKSRFAKSALLLAVFLLVSGVGAPVWGRENISAGQSGDPGDGLDVYSGASNGSMGDGGSSESNATVRPVRAPSHNPDVLLIPYFNGSTLRFVIMTDVKRVLERLK